MSDASIIADRIEPEIPVGSPEPADRPAPRRSRPLRRLADVLLLLAVSLALFLPGFFTMPVTDRDEARFVQATKQMVETGDWIDIRFQGEPRYKKPVGIYWMQGAAVLASGQGAEAPIWVYRIPSLIGATLAVLLIYAIGATLGGPGVGLVAGLLAAATVIIGLDARIAKTDGAQLAAIMAAQWALASLWMDPERRRLFWRNAVFWTAIGLGVLIKGPVVMLVAFSTLAVLAIAERSTAMIRALSPLKGLAYALALVLPWLIAIGWISGGAFFAESVGRDMLGKIATGQESHGAPPGMHALVAIGTFWPLSALVPAAIAFAIRARGPAVTFLAAWILPSWIVFELVATKLPNYVLPLMPAFAVMAALALFSGGLDPHRGWRRTMVGFVAFGAILLGFGLNGAFVFIEQRASIPGIVGALVASAAGILAFRLMTTGRLKSGIAALVLTGGLATATGFGLLLPAAGQLWLTDRMVEARDALGLSCRPQVTTVGYDEPSVVFSFGTDTLMTSAEAAARRFASADCALAFVRVDQVEAFQSGLAAAGAQAVPRGEVEARNFNGLELRAMQIYAKP